MSQLNLKDRSSSGADKLSCRIAKMESDSDAAKKAEVVIPAIALSRQESLNLLRELVQMSRLQQKEELSFTIPLGKSGEHLRLERIRELEKALEQSLNYLHELKQSLKQQQMLEAQLVAAEDIANLQQQAITQLKQQLAQQHLLQAQLQQACWELEQERDRSCQIEQQNIALQEHILQQCQQTGEYEAAMHYWKELALKLKETLAQLWPSCEIELSELLGKDQLLAAEAVAPKTQLSLKLRKQPHQVELPPFLTKQRRH